MPHGDSLHGEIVQGEDLAIWRRACGKGPEPWRHEIGGKGFSKLRQDLRVGAPGKFGDSGKPVDFPGISLGDCREQTLADGIPGEGFVRVAFVFPKIQPKVLGVGKELFFPDA